MKESKGFLLVELAVVILLMGSLLLFVIHSFSGCVKTSAKAKDVQKVQTLAERTIAGEEVELPAHWQLLVLDKVVQGVSLREVQVLDVQNGKIIFNLLWMQ